jgi:dolichyl-phosphate beta-glucosyltransferase
MVMHVDGASARRPAISIVIPAFNEAHRLPASLASIRAYVGAQAWPSEVLVVDDGSSDATAAIVEECAEGWRALRLIRRPHRGKGAALSAGMLAAAGDYIAIADADLSMPVAEFDRFSVDALGPYDIAIGSREAPGARRFGEPWYRHLMGRVFNRVVQLLVLPGIQDTQCGFKCLRREVAVELCQCQTVAGWGFDVELLYAARQRGYRIVEVPINWYYKADSRVRLARDTISMVRDVLSIRANSRQGRYLRQVAAPIDAPVAR